MNAIGFFQAQFCFPIGDDMVTAALVLAGVDPEAQLADIDIQGKELTKAHLLRMVAQTYLNILLRRTRWYPVQILSLRKWIQFSAGEER